jgi:hypothetical protein
VKYCGRLNNSTDSNIPAVLYWRQSCYRIILKSLASTCKKNSLRNSANFISFDINPLANTIMKPITPVPSAILKPLLMKVISSLDRNQVNVAGTLQMSPTDSKHRHALSSFAFADKKIRIPVLRWLIGCVAMHTKCKSCNDQVSRAHAVQCSGANNYLLGTYNDDYKKFINENAFGTFIDYLLNLYRFALPGGDFYSNIAKAIGLIYTKCLGYKQQSNGFYSQAVEDVAAPEVHRRRQQDFRAAVLGRTVQGRQAARAARRQQVLNRPIRRPRRPG